MLLVRQSSGFLRFWFFQESLIHVHSFVFLISTRAPTMTIPHILITSLSRSLYFYNFSVSLFATLRLDGTSLPMKIYLFSFLTLITISGLLAIISLLLWIGISYSMNASFPQIIVLGLPSYHLEGAAISTYFLVHVDLSFVMSFKEFSFRQS